MTPNLRNFTYPTINTVLANGCRGAGGMGRRVSCVGSMLVILTLGVLVEDTAAQDVTGPHVRLVSVHNDPQLEDTYVFGDKIAVVVWFTEEIEVTGSPTLDLTIGTETRRMTRSCVVSCKEISTISFEYVIQATDYDSDGISVAPDALKLNGGTVTDSAGNDADLHLGEHAISNDPALKVNGRLDPAPVVTRLDILSTPASGDTYGRHEQILLRIFFNKPLVVSGSPRLALTIGTERRFAVVVTLAGVGGRIVDFKYQVQAGDHDSDGFSIAADALRLEGGSMRDRNDNDLDLSLAGYTVTNAPGHKVNGANETRPTVKHLGLSGIPQGDDETFIRGDEIRVYLQFNRELVVTGSPTVALTIGTQVRQASLLVSGGLGPVFGYRVQADDYDPDGVSLAADALRLNGGSMRDAAGIDADLSLAGYVVTNDPHFKVDGGINYPPRVDSVTLVSQPRQDDTYRSGERIRVGVAFDEPVTVSGRPFLEIEIGTETRRAYAIPTGYDGQDFVEFRYAVQPPDLDLDGLGIGPDALILEGGSIRDASGNVAETDLSRQTISNDPLHKVDGGRVRAVASLPALEVTVGGTKTVDLSEVFHSDFTIAYAATSSDADVAELSLSGSSLTVVGVGEGTATIEATASDEFGTASLQFPVTAVTDPAEVEGVGEHAGGDGPEPAVERDDDAGGALRGGVGVTVGDGGGPPGSFRDRRGGGASATRRRGGANACPRRRGGGRPAAGGAAGRCALGRCARPAERPPDAGIRCCGAASLRWRLRGLRRRTRLKAGGRVGRSGVRATCNRSRARPGNGVEYEREPAGGSRRRGRRRRTLACGRVRLPRGGQSRLSVRGEWRGESGGDADERAAVFPVGAESRYRGVDDGGRGQRHA